MMAGGKKWCTEELEGGNLVKRNMEFSAELNAIEIQQSNNIEFIKFGG